MPQAEPWRGHDAEIDAVVGARHGDPFAFLGPHAAPGGVVVRAFVPGAERLTAVTAAGETPLQRRRDEGFFEGLIPVALGAAYRLKAGNGGGEWTFEDPFAFGPVLGEVDDYLMVEGSHRRLYERLGAHLAERDGVGGVAFALWAPRAQRVSVVGDFNGWDGRRNPLRRRVDSGLWEGFAPGLREGAVYKYEILGANGDVLPLKADPFGFEAEMRPSTASVAARTDQFDWSDGAWMERRARQDWRRAPMSIYEVHLGSWRRRWDGGGFQSYDEMAEQLVDYAVGNGFTHLELLPVTEHPLDDSWGYQPVGLFAPTRRFGDAAGFQRFVDRAHSKGIGVILDWVPAHFPTDSHGLGLFDGLPLYEHADPRRGFHPDWNTAIYDFGRREVANYLIASAQYWLDRFHIDGLRVDAVASMLYLDYSRRDGEWLPNDEGGNTNKEAVGFLRQANELVYAEHPGAVMIAEESTSWPGVSAPVYAGGLGFGFKWNMGWMNDTLSYMSQDPLWRRDHHDKLTFGLMYAFSENFVLPISHDEVVHGKGSVIGRMPGDDWKKFAGARALYGFMWGYPGKKLLFMGQEFGQRREWDFRQALDWDSLDHAPHQGLLAAVRDLNTLYASVPALHARDCEAEGFQWLVVDDRDNSVFAWVRRGGEGDAPVAVVCNFSAGRLEDYALGLPHAGRWREIFNSDAAIYGGSGAGNLGGVSAAAGEYGGQPASARITVPPLAVVYLQYEGGA